MDTSLVTGFYEELDVCVHEGDCHGDIATIREDKFWVVAELFDKTENVVLDSAYSRRVVVPIVHNSIRTSGPSIRK